MNLRTLSTLVLKDLKLYFANQFFALVTGLGLAAYIAMYFLLPARVDEQLELGLYLSEMPGVFKEMLAEEEVNFVLAESDEALREAVHSGDLPAGYSFPDGSLEEISRGEPSEVNLYFSSDLPEEFKSVYAVILDEFAFALSGQDLDIEVSEEVLGPDMAGEQIPPRQRMLPLLTIFILMIETLGLASLISSEIQAGTLQALLVTPLRVEGLFVAKGLFGTLFAFSQTAILMGFTGGFSREPLLIVVTLLLGSALVTGIGFLMASASKDLMSVMSWGILAILLLAIPSFSVLIPGIANEWIRILPSYYLVDTTYRVHNFDAGWGEVNGNLLILMAFTVVFMALGVVILRRKMR